MPRNLARLRFRAPKKVVPVPVARNVTRLPNLPHHVVERQVRRHVLSRSQPSTALALHYVVDPRWKRLPGKKGRKLAHKPHTLRDLVDPQAKKQHGEVIYIFKNIRTNQVIYSLAELLDVSTCGIVTSVPSGPLMPVEFPPCTNPLHREAL